MKTIVTYVCEVCNAEWDHSSEAEACEMSHCINLNIVDKDFAPKTAVQPYGFPFRIIVDDSTCSGHAAEYVLVKEGAAEDFEPYHPPEFYEYD